MQDVEFNREEQPKVKLDAGKTYRITVKLERYQIKIRIHGNPAAPEKKDDSVTLETTDGSYRKTLPLAAGEPCDGGVIMTFTGLKADKEYNLLIDPGAEGEPYYVIKNYPAPKDKLQQHCKM